MPRKSPRLLFGILLPLSFIPWILGGDLTTHTAYVVVFYLLLPSLIGRAMGFEWGEMGIALPNGSGWRLFALLFLLSIPVSIYGTTVPSMKEYYPIFEYSGWTDFVLKELLIGLVMLAHEAFFRGFLLFPIARENETLGIILQDIPYTIVHLGKPGIEVPYSFIAGIVFAKMDLKGESFVPSFLLHWLGSVLFDVLCVLL